MQLKAQSAISQFGADVIPVRLSVIIVNWNTAELLRRCLQSVFVACGDMPREVIVVDNASSDGSAAMVRREFPSIFLIQNTQNVGFAKANNQVIPQAQGDYILLLNSDTLIPATTPLSAWIEFMDRHPEAGGTRMQAHLSGRQPSGRGCRIQAVPDYGGQFRILPFPAIPLPLPGPLRSKRECQPGNGGGLGLQGPTSSCADPSFPSQGCSMRERSCTPRMSNGAVASVPMASKYITCPT